MFGSSFSKKDKTTEVREVKQYTKYHNDGSVTYGTKLVLRSTKLLKEVTNYSSGGLEEPRDGTTAPSPPLPPTNEVPPETGIRSDGPPENGNGTVDPASLMAEIISAITDKGPRTAESEPQQTFDVDETGELRCTICDAARESGVVPKHSCGRREPKVTAPDEQQEQKTPEPDDNDDDIDDYVMVEVSPPSSERKVRFDIDGHIAYPERTYPEKLVVSNESEQGPDVKGGDSTCDSLCSEEIDTSSGATNEQQEARSPSSLVDEEESSRTTRVERGDGSSDRTRLEDEIPSKFCLCCSNIKDWQPKNCSCLCLESYEPEDASLLQQPERFHESDDKNRCCHHSHRRHHHHKRHHTGMCGHVKIPPGYPCVKEMVQFFDKKALEYRCKPGVGNSSASSSKVKSCKKLDEADSTTAVAAASSTSSTPTTDTGHQERQLCDKADGDEDDDEEDDDQSGTNKCSADDNDDESSCGSCCLVGHGHEGCGAAVCKDTAWDDEVREDGCRCVNDDDDNDKEDDGNEIDINCKLTLKDIAFLIVCIALGSLIYFSNELGLEFSKLA